MTLGENSISLLCVYGRTHHTCMYDRMQPLNKEILYDRENQPNRPSRSK
jgi:hypothetical protein